MMIVPLAAAVLLWFLLVRTSTARRWLAAVLPQLPAKALAVALAMAAMLVAVRGNVWAALCLFGLSLWTLGRAGRGAGGVGGPPPSPPPASALIEMAADPSSGRLRGRVLAGAFAGRDLDALDQACCKELYATCVRFDPAGARLLEPYLHGRFAGWRATAQADADFGGRRARFTSRMTEEQAYQVLGLGRGASRADVVRSHRSAMKKWHPDQGGTADLAALANEAKEVLLRRHN